jgi:hypothetical protein
MSQQSLSFASTLTPNSLASLRSSLFRGTRGTSTQDSEANQVFRYACSSAALHSPIFASTAIIWLAANVVFKGSACQQPFALRTMAATAKRSNWSSTDAEKKLRSSSVDFEPSFPKKCISRRSEGVRAARVLFHRRAIDSFQMTITRSGNPDGTRGSRKTVTLCPLGTRIKSCSRNQSSRSCSGPALPLLKERPGVLADRCASTTNTSPTFR